MDTSTLSTGQAALTSNDLSVVSGESSRADPANNISIVCYDAAVPANVEAELDRLYGNMFSSLPQLRASGVAYGASTYVVRRSGEIVSVWLFVRERNVVRILNEGMCLTEVELCRFADYIFANDRSLSIVALHAVYLGHEAVTGCIPYPVQRYNCLEDIVLTLPDTVDDYRASLGRSTRSYLNRYLNKLKRDFPSYRHHSYVTDEIDPAQLMQVFELNRERMRQKGKVSIIDDREAKRITKVALERGLLSVVTINDRICAGTIQYRMGDNYFMEVIGHDSAYNDYRLGTLCCYLAVSECIQRGGKEYHFLWGTNDYKFRLGGVQRDLECVTLYRSRLRCLLNPTEVMRNAYQRNRRRFRLWLHAEEHREGGVAAGVSAALHWWRALRNRMHGKP